MLPDSAPQPSKNTSSAPPSEKKTLNDGPPEAQIDLRALADKVYELMKKELRLERERR